MSGCHWSNPAGSGMNSLVVILTLRTLTAPVPALVDTSTNARNESVCRPQTLRHTELCPKCSAVIISHHSYNLSFLMFICRQNQIYESTMKIISL